MARAGTADPVRNLAKTRLMPHRPWSAGSWLADISVGLDGVLVAVGAGPGEGPGSGAVVGPGAVGLVPVVSAAERREVPGVAEVSNEVRKLHANKRRPFDGCADARLYDP